MKRSILAIVLALATLIAGSAVASAGNGAPQGPHEYQLNIIGMSKGKNNVDMDNNGHRIFVNLDNKSKINLVEGDDFAVIDANGTDRDGATFQMPPPGYNAFDINDPCGDELEYTDDYPCDVISSYSVYVRPLGKPTGAATMTTCADINDSVFRHYFSKTFVRAVGRAAANEFGGECSLEQVTQELERGKGKSSFQNVTAELTSIVVNVTVDVDGDLGTTGDQYEVTVRIPIFDEALENEYWEYDNNGLRLAQVRFYEVCTDVSALDVDGNPTNAVVPCPQ